MSQQCHSWGQIHWSWALLEISAWMLTVQCRQQTLCCYTIVLLRLKTLRLGNILHQVTERIVLTDSFQPIYTFIVLTMYPCRVTEIHKYERIMSLSAVFHCLLVHITKWKTKSAHDQRDETDICCSQQHPNGQMRWVSKAILGSLSFY